MKEKAQDYLILFVSILIVGFAITLIAKAQLGATAVTSLAFVISQLSGLSFGMMTGLFNLIYVILQIAIQRKDFPKIQLFQIGVSFILGFAVDFANYLLRDLLPETYIQQLMILLIGCVIMGFGVFLQLKAAKVYNPAEGIVNVVADVMNRPFGVVKTVFDVTLVILAVLLGLSVTGSVIGVREGTIVSALIIGPIIGVFQKLTNKLADT